jgi:threonine/homoserine/homoserine lactone efflux protein
MPFEIWIQIVLICSLGAMSPGPSLALVVGNTVSGGRQHGVMTGVGHGVGILFYASLVVAGLGVLISTSPQLFLLLQWGGALFLGYLGFRYLFPGEAVAEGVEAVEANQGGLFVQGFLIAFLNPKIAAFFFALFSQFLRPEAGWGEKSVMALTAGVIDAAWYVTVATILAGSRLLGFLHQHQKRFDQSVGVLLILLAVGVVLRVP